jgi:Holliday junction resolvase RusA-like endonuclease
VNNRVLDPAILKELGGKPKRKRKSKAEHAARFAATPPAPLMVESEQRQQRALFERHDAAVVTIRLPLPPSSNNSKIIRHVPGKPPWLASSGEYEAYKAVVAKLWKAHWNERPPAPLTGRLRILAIVHQSRRGGDILNREKTCIDSLVQCGAFLDDEQIDDAHFIRGAVVSGGCIDLTIEVIPE